MNWVFGVAIGVLVFLFFVFWISMSGSSGFFSTKKSGTKDSGLEAKKSSEEKADEESGDGVDKQDGAKSFHQLYLDFGNDAMEYLSGGVRKTSLNNSIDRLSEVLCSQDKGEVAKLYAKKVDLLDKLVEIYRQHDDLKCSTPEVAELKKKVRECSDKLSKKMCGCLDVKYAEIRYFYTLSDSIIISHSVEKKKKEKEKIKSVFADLVSKMKLD